MGYYDPVPISGISLIRLGDYVEVHVIVGSQTVVAFRERYDANFSHHVTAGGLMGLIKNDPDKPDPDQHPRLTDGDSPS